MITRATAAKLKTQNLSQTKMDLDNTLTAVQDDNIPTLENAKQHLHLLVKTVKTENKIQN
jgi:hypothetical protein